MKNNILALVLARKNSKRLKNKNILKLGKIPLILWTLRDLIKLKKYFVDIILSSDSKKILNFIKHKNILQINRPKKYSTSNSSSEISALHAIKFYETIYKKKISHIILFQPTSPFRSKRDILNAITLSNKNKKKRIVSCRIEKNKRKKKYLPNGSFYISPIEMLKKSKNFVGKKFIPFVIKSKKNNIDIDTINDFQIAKKYV
tara:strand:+ start:539 stop:1144 length:606 start_codon:yes stop_codon:yes gene_type:complete